MREARLDEVDAYEPKTRGNWRRLLHADRSEERVEDLDVEYHDFGLQVVRVL